MICEECGQPFTPSGRGKKAKYCSAKCKQRAYRRAKRMSRVTTPPAPAGDVEHEPEAMDTLTAADFDAMMNDGPGLRERAQTHAGPAQGSYVQRRHPAGQPDRHQQQLLALTREIERLEGNPVQGMTTLEDSEDDDDDGEFRPEAI